MGKKVYGEADYLVLPIELYARIRLNRCKRPFVMFCEQLNGTAIER